MTAQITRRRAEGKGYQSQPLPVVCAWCKARQRHGGTWGPLDATYDTTQASHGICPDCFAHELKKLKRRW